KNGPLDTDQYATTCSLRHVTKRMVMDAVCQFEEVFRDEKIDALRNDGLVYRSWGYMDKKTQMHADYDACWESLGGERIKAVSYTNVTLP
uniref:DUF535 family protein n=1 Tax=Salmonella enterica TaxID=28901 RepID=UPI00398C6ABA